jgi:hypothetical protein
MNKLPPIALKEPFITDQDYVQGGLTSIDYVERNPAGDWSKWLPTREPQKFKFDTNECSTISATKALEIQFNFLRNDFSIEALQWFTANGYIDDNGNFNFSERFNGIMAGTSINGNSQNYVWESIRKVGLLPQKDLNYSYAQSENFLTQWDMCEDYYNPDVVTDFMKIKAKQVFRWITIQYEWVGANSKVSTPYVAIVKALKQAPVQIGAPACPDWNSGDVHPCGKTQAEHATTIYGWTLNSYKDFDHYNPYLKTLSTDYFIPYAIKAVVTVNPVVKEVPYVTYSILIQVLLMMKRLGIKIMGTLNGKL